MVCKPVNYCSAFSIIYLRQGFISPPKLFPQLIKRPPAHSDQLLVAEVKEPTELPAEIGKTTVVVMMVVRRRVHLESSDHNLPVLVAVPHENKITDVFQKNKLRAASHLPTHILCPGI